MENLYAEQRQVNGWSIVKIVGEVDTSAASLLREYLSRVINDENRDLALDMSGMTFVDRSGPDLLLRMKDLLKERSRKLALLSPTLQIARSLVCFGLDEVFQIYAKGENLPVPALSESARNSFQAS